MSKQLFLDPESIRLDQDQHRVRNWKRWGPYLSERQWGTVREDYSPGGDSWADFPHEQARSRAYRWGEDGLLGISDRQCRLCFALALWNEKDPILKERLFGLTGPEGNHGEDVKELYYYLDSTPTHSYMKAAYKYPHSEYPYAQIVQENGRRGREEPEFELLDTGALNEDRYFDVIAEYAKADDNDVLIRITVHNRGPEQANLHLLPTLWFRNTWSWGCKHEGCEIKPRITRVRDDLVRANHSSLETFWCAFGSSPGGESPELLFTENETNQQRLWGTPNLGDHTKDAFHDYVVQGRSDAVNPMGIGTKVAAHHRLSLNPGERASVEVRLCMDQGAEPSTSALLGPLFKQIFETRLKEADRFYRERIFGGINEEERNVVRQAYAGLMWTKQFYHLVINDWFEGDSEGPKPPEARKQGRNKEWKHLFNRDIISMPDKWEYPWYAAWDLAFHMIPFARVDPHFAKSQLILFLREWYMHPNGQIPAYEFEFSDVNPPVHAWAVWRVYKRTAAKGTRDRAFLARAFHKLMLNFTWWVNRKDAEGNHIFSGGFLGLDNIGVFDRSRPLPGGGQLEQADGTAWMAFFCTTMLAIALELAKEDSTYEDVASKFFEHFVAIVDAINNLGDGLWDETDGFYYDQLHIDGRHHRLKVRSLVGLVPLFAGLVIDQSTLAQLPGFAKRTRWFLENRKDLARHIALIEEGPHVRNLLAIPSKERLARVLQYVFDEREFLSPYGVRSLSKVHDETPYVFEMGGERHTVQFIPGESNTPMFGGNSNWRGPIWLPMNYLLVEAIEQYHYFYGDDFKVELPTGSGNWVTLAEAANDLERRLSSIFLPQEDGARPCLADRWGPSQSPHFKDLLLFHEYFHSESGLGLGANHQTGWTALAINFIEGAAKARSG